MSDADDHDDFSPRSGQTRSKLKRKNVIFDKLESLIDAEDDEAVMEQEEPEPPLVVKRRSLRIQLIREKKEQESFSSVEERANEKPKKQAKGQRKRSLKSDSEDQRLVDDHDDFSPRSSQTRSKLKRKNLILNKLESFIDAEELEAEPVVVEQEKPGQPPVPESLRSQLVNKEKEVETEDKPKRKYTRKAKDVKEQQNFTNVEETPEDKPKRKYTRKSKELKEQQNFVAETPEDRPKRKYTRKSKELKEQQSFVVEEAPQEKPKRKSARKIKEVPEQQNFADVSKTPKEKPKRKYTRKIKEEPIDFEDYTDASFQLPLPSQQQEEQEPDHNQMQLVPYQGGRRAQQLNIISSIDPEFLRFEIESQASCIDDLQQSIATIDNQASVLKNENLSLRRSSLRNEEIAVNEKQRAEEAWKKLDMMRLYNRACEQGAEQRYFHEMKISDTADEVKEETGKKVKILMDKRCELAEEKAVLTTKVRVLMKKMKKAKKRFDEDHDWRKFKDLVKAITEVLRQSGVDGELLISTLEEKSSDLFTECIHGGGISVEMDNYFKMIIQGLGNAVGGTGMQITLGVYGEINVTDESSECEGESDDSDEDE